MIRLALRGAARAFFRRIEGEGLENVPASGPILILPNHANALVDPVVLQILVPRRLTLTAKNVLAKNPLVAFLMRRLDVIAFHRGQDRALGADPAQNATALAECRRRLREGAAICLFPEGVSHSDPQLRPFKSGAARLALEVEAEGGADLLLVPAGLHYESKERFRSRAFAAFGPPLSVRAWREANPHGTAEELTVTIAESVGALTLNVARRREEALLQWTADVLVGGGEEPAALDRPERPLSERVSILLALQRGYARLRNEKTAEVEALATRVRRWHTELRRLGVTPAEVTLPIHVGRAAFFVLREAEVLLVGLPFALVGLLLHGIPYLVTRAVARRLSTDKDHWASNVVIPSLAVFPLFWALELAATAWLLSPLAALLLALLVPYTGVLCLHLADRAGNAIQRARTFLTFLLHRETQERLSAEQSALRDDILALA